MGRKKSAPVAWKRPVAGILLGGFALLMLLGLWSYRPGAAVSRNWAGPVGHGVAGTLLEATGVGGYALGLFLLAIACALVIGRPRISFARAGLTVNWSSRFQNLLEFAEACDVPVRWSCRTGVCHNCETTLIAGAVDYSPEPVDPPADGSVLICCSQPRDNVVLDL